MRPLVSAFLVLLLSFPATGATVVGPEQPLAPPAFGPAYGYQQPQTLATDGTDFLLAWVDETGGREGVYAVVLDEHGTTRPLPARPLARGTGKQSPRAVWTGDAYLLLWIGDGRALMAARLDRDAQLLSGPTVVVAEPSGVTSVAWNGRRALATVTNATGGDALLLDASGGVERKVTYPARSAPPHSRVVAATGGFVVSWTEVVYVTDRRGNTTASTSVHAARVSDDGEAGPRVEVFAAADHLIVDAASDGARVGLVVSHFPLGRLQRFTLDATTLAITAHAPVDYPSGEFARAISTPDGFASVYLSYATDGVRLVAHPFESTSPRIAYLGPGYGSQLLLAASDRAVMTVWQNPGVLSAALDLSLSRRTREVTPATISAIAQDVPHVAPAGDVALVTWVDVSGDTGRLVGVRVNRAGHVLDAQPIVIGSHASGERAVVFTGEVWLAAWEQYELSGPPGLVTRRIARDGTLLDAAPVIVGDAGQPAMASNGDVTVLAMVASGLPGISTLRYSRNGHRIDATPRGGLEREGYTPALATNGRELFLVWEEGWPNWPHNTPNLRGIYGIRLDAGGSPIDAAPITIVESKLDESAPQIATDGTDFLVLYHQDYTKLHTKRVLRNGALADATAEQPGTPVGEGWFSRLAFIGPRYLVTYVACCSGNAPIHGVALDSRGVPVEDVRVVQPGARNFAIEAANGLAWLAYSRLVDDAVFGNVPRVFVRTLAEAPGRRRAARR